MEFYLNYAWMFAAVASVCLWLRLDRHSLESRHMQFVGLFLFVVMLFPVISVTDDMWTVQSPAETKTFDRRHQRAASPHPAFQGIAALPDRASAEKGFDSQPFGALLHAPLLAADSPAFDPIQNRPPPWA